MTVKHATSTRERYVICSCLFLVTSLKLWLVASSVRGLTTATRCLLASPPELLINFSVYNSHWRVLCYTSWHIRPNFDGARWTSLATGQAACFTRSGNSCVQRQSAILLAWSRVLSRNTCIGQVVMAEAPEAPSKHLVVCVRLKIYSLF